MKETYDKVLICNSCYKRLDCGDIRYGENFCFLYKNIQKSDLIWMKNAKTGYKKIDAQDTIESSNDDLK